MTISSINATAVMSPRQEFSSNDPHVEDISTQVGLKCPWQWREPFLHQQRRLHPRSFSPSPWIVAIHRSSKHSGGISTKPQCSQDPVETEKIRTEIKRLQGQWADDTVETYEKDDDIRTQLLSADFSAPDTFSFLYEEEEEGAHHRRSHNCRTSIDSLSSNSSSSSSSYVDVDEINEYQQDEYPLLSDQIDDDAYFIITCHFKNLNPKNSNETAVKALNSSIQQELLSPNTSPTLQNTNDDIDGPPSPPYNLERKMEHIKDKCSNTPTATRVSARLRKRENESVKADTMTTRAGRKKPKHAVTTVAPSQA